VLKVQNVSESGTVPNLELAETICRVSELLTER